MNAAGGLGEQHRREHDAERDRQEELAGRPTRVDVIANPPTLRPLVARREVAFVARAQRLVLALARAPGLSALGLRGELAVRWDERAAVRRLGLLALRRRSSLAGRLGLDGVVGRGRRGVGRWFLLAGEHGPSVVEVRTTVVG